jgi:integrase
MRAIDVTSAHAERYIAERLEAGRARATINRELGALKQAFRLAVKQERVTRAPYLPWLREDNARQGFFEHADFEAVVTRLPEPIADLARFAYLSGWRRGEILGLTWSAVDRDAKQVRLRTSKNGHGRVLALEGALADLMERRWSAREIEEEGGVIRLATHVFHRAGVPVVDFQKPWTLACREAGVAGKLFHDLRRTAVRNMIRAGASQPVAMSVSGHRTVSMFQRYDITTDDDQREALRRMQAHVSAQPLRQTVVPMATERNLVTHG